MPSVLFFSSFLQIWCRTWLVGACQSHHIAGLTPEEPTAPTGIVLPSKPYFSLMKSKKGPNKKKPASKMKPPRKASAPSPSPPPSESYLVASKPTKHGFAPGSKVVPSQKIHTDVVKSAFSISMPKKGDGKVSYPSKTDKQFRSGLVSLMALFDANVITEYPNGHDQYEYEHDPLSTDKAKKAMSMKVHKFCANHNIKFAPKVGKWIEHQVGETVNHGFWSPSNVPDSSPLYVEHAEILIKLNLLQKEAP
jgi:hypothetical protein